MGGFLSKSENLLHYDDREASNICPEHISFTHGGILMNLHRNVHHYEKLCHTHKTGL
jgi:hypothetical protein